MDGTNRKQRRAARAEGNLDTAAFLKVADKFIDAANRQNARIKATDLHMAFLYASARYSAYVANSILEVANHEDFVKDMTVRYQEMLRQHLADPALAKPTSV
jgi:peroxiredoxin